MAKYEWYKTSHTGIRYRKHPTRKNGVGADQYFVIRYQRGGKTVDETIGWASRMTKTDREKYKSPLKKAIARLAEIEEAIRTGKGPQSLKEARKIKAEETATKEQQAITFSEFWEMEYLPSCKAEKKASSWAAEELWFKNWINPRIGGKRLVDVSQIDVERVKSDMLKADLTSRSVQYCIAVIRQVFNTAARRGRFLGDNPARMVKVRLGDNKRVRFLTREEAAALLEELDRRSLQLHDIALLSLHCGLRAGEVFSLSWDCIDFDQGTIFIRDTKSGKNRHAFMTDDVKEMVSRRYTGKPGLVFPARDGGRIKSVSDSFIRAVDALGLNDDVADSRQKVVFHTLRHTFASWLVQGETPLYTVAKLMGHSTIAMTERYAHLAPGNMRGAVKRMEEAMNIEPVPGDRKVLQFRR